MTKLFITFYIIFQILSNLSFAANKTSQSFEDMTAELKAKKAELEPFDQKKVKVDLESLGLDVVEEKSKSADAKSDNSQISNQVGADKKASNISTEIPAPASPVVEFKEVEPASAIDLSKINNLSAGNNASHNSPSNAKKNYAIKKSKIKKDPSVKITNNKKIKEPIIEVKKTVKAKEYVNSKNKAGLKKRLEKESLKTKNEILQDEGSKKLDDLRKQYLGEVDKETEEKSDLAESTFQDLPVVIPRRKEIGKFDSKDSPPPPILNNFRTSDNIHIPLISSDGEKIKFLFDTIIANDPSIFDEAFKLVGNVNVTNEYGDTILTFAILLKKYPVIASILTKGADPNMPNKLGYTPLALAIEMADSKSLELLFNNKVDINYVDAYGRSYLIQAARVGFLPAVELLIAGGVDVNKMDNDGFTALLAAYRHKKEVIVKYLLKNGAKTWVEKPYDSDSQSIMLELKDRWK